MEVINDTSTITLILTSSGKIGSSTNGTYNFRGSTGILGMTLKNSSSSSGSITFLGNASYIDSETGDQLDSQAIPLEPGGIIQENAPASKELIFTVTVPAGATAYLILVR